MIDKISVSTPSRTKLVDISRQIQEVIDEKKVQTGVLHIFCPHTTAALAINENCDPSVQSDISKTLNKLIPHNAGYDHAEGNADVHIKSAVVGSSRTLFIDQGKIAFGTWQGIYLCEFDGPRTREIWVKIIKE